MINEYGNPVDATPISNPGTAEAPSNDEVISTLNNLIETCRDGQEGFKQAAEGVERSDLKSLFYDYSQQRAQFVGELQDLVRTLGGDPENTGSMTGAIHRGWINIKSAVTGKDEAAVLNECERGEDSAKNQYKDSLELTLPTHVQHTIQSQYSKVLEAHDRVKALRDAANGDKSTSARTGF